tara:strand:+ start:401 stop:1132 length:732 start_codon:yes stop_codon:yes gene_type:complete
MLGLGNSIASSGSTGFHPSDISGLVANFNFLQGLTLSSEFVTNWEDTTGSYNLQPEAAGLRPTYSIARGLIFAGGDAATGDRLELKDSGGDPATITLDTSSNGFCVITQYASDNWDDGKNILGEHDGDSAMSLHHRSGNNSFDFTIKDTTKNFALNTTTLVDGDYASIILNGANDGATKLYIDGEEQDDTETFASTDDFQINQVGAANNTDVLVGNVKNIIIYDKELSTAELAQIESYLLPYR